MSYKIRIYFVVSFLYRVVRHGTASSRRLCRAGSGIREKKAAVLFFSGVNVYRAGVVWYGREPGRIGMRKRSVKERRRRIGAAVFWAAVIINTAALLTVVWVSLSGG